jgi:multiple sugar transport system permease protein
VDDYFGPLTLIEKAQLFTIPLAVGNFSNFYATDQVVLFAELAIAIVPPLLLFAFLQRSFTDGLTVGASRY